MARTPKEDTYPQTIRFPVSWQERIIAWAEHHGSVNTAVNAAVREAVLAFENEDSTRTRVKRMDEAGIPEQLAEIRAELADIKKCQSLNTAISFAGLNALDMTIRISDADWQRIEQLIVAAR